jgi:hypothetical protein
MKYWEIIADNLKTAGWSWGWVSALDVEERTIWIVDAHRGESMDVRHVSRHLGKSCERKSSSIPTIRSTCVMNCSLAKSDFSIFSFSA